MRSSMASALNVMFEPLRGCFEKVERRIDIARGSEALDGACAGAEWGSALEVFG
jgi:hypothetical protein